MVAGRANDGECDRRVTGRDRAGGGDRRAGRQQRDLMGLRAEVGIGIEPAAAARRAVAEQCEVGGIVDRGRLAFGGRAERRLDELRSRAVSNAIGGGGPSFRAFGMAQRTRGRPSGHR